MQLSCSRAQSAADEVTLSVRRNRPQPGLRWNSMETVVYGRYRSVAEIPDLVEMQTRSYHNFLQPETAPNRRKVEGLEALLREIFPIYSYDKTLCLEYVSYELGRPRYTVEECRKLRVTYGYPFKIRVRLVKPEPVEEDIYLGEIPIMIGVRSRSGPASRVSASKPTTPSVMVIVCRMEDVHCNPRAKPAAGFSRRNSATPAPAVVGIHRQRRPEPTLAGRPQVCRSR